MPFLQEIEKLPFFWGKLSQKEAEKTLSTKPIGSFMLRLEENGFIALSVRSKDFRNIVQDYVPYGTHTYKKDTKETIIKAIEELTPAKYPVLRKMPSLVELSAQKHVKNVDVDFDFEQMILPAPAIASMKEAKNDCLLKGFLCAHLDLEEKSKHFEPSGIQLTREDWMNVETNFKSFEGQNTELDDFMPPLIFTDALDI